MRHGLTVLVGVLTLLAFPPPGSAQRDDLEALLKQINAVADPEHRLATIDSPVFAQPKKGEWRQPQ